MLNRCRGAAGRATIADFELKWCGGGVVAYVTCSPHLAETELVVADVLRGRADVVQEDARPLVPELADVGDGPAVQMWPHRHGTDAMYLALLRRL